MAGVLTGTKREVSAAQYKDDWFVGGGTERPADGLCHHPAVQPETHVHVSPGED